MWALEGDEAGSTNDSIGAFAMSIASVPLAIPGLMTAEAAPEDETAAVDGTVATCGAAAEEADTTVADVEDDDVWIMWLKLMPMGEWEGVSCRGDQVTERQPLESVDLDREPQQG